METRRCSLDYLTRPSALQGSSEQAYQADKRAKSLHLQATYARAVEEVERTAIAMAEAYNAHDWDLYASFLAPSFAHHWQHRPGNPLSKEEHLTRTRDLCKVSPNYKIEVLDGMSITPDVPDCGGRRGTIKVLQNCRQVGNAKLGEDLGRDGFHMLTFAQIQGKWLCQSLRGAMGCYYFDAQPDPLQGSQHGAYSQAVEEIKRAAKDMAQAFNDHDWHRYASFLLPSFTYHAQEGPTPRLSKDEFLRQTEDFCTVNPNCKLDVLDQMVTMPDSAVLLTGVWSVFQNCRRLGDVRGRNNVRDCCYILKFVSVDGRWLCHSSQWANGCHYFELAT